MATKSTDPLIGKQFRSVIADCNCLFTVQKKQGRNGYRCVVVNEKFKMGDKEYDGEYAGQVGLFTKADVEAKVRWMEAGKRMFATQDQFVADLVVGSTVHYDDGFGQFIRCEVVLLAEDLGFGRTAKAGEKMLRMKELVGTWRDYDLVATSLKAKYLREGHLFMPNHSCVFEHPKYARKPGVPDPRTLPALEIRGQQEMFA
jgi:hypothetical protein